MKVPQHIREKMLEVGNFSRKAAAAMYDIEIWLEDNGYDTTKMMQDGGRFSLKELRYGSDVVDGLCDRIEGGWCKYDL